MMVDGDGIKRGTVNVYKYWLRFLHELGFGNVTKDWMNLFFKLNTKYYSY